MKKAADSLFIRDLVDGKTAEPFDQLAGRGNGINPAPVHKGDAFAECLCLFHVVGGQKDCHSPVLELTQQGPGLAA